jgi:hypothetical protein
MKNVIFLVLATTLAGALSGCGVTYEERTAYRADPAYYAEPYVPARTYYSRDDYYRHYNGIDG